MHNLSRSFVVVSFLTGLMTVPVLAEHDINVTGASKTVGTSGHQTDNTYKVPVIESVTVSPDTIAFKGVATYKVKVKSSTPVNWLNSCLETPLKGKTRWGGGSGVTFKQLDADTYEYESTIDFSKWDAAGDYTLGCLSVGNEAKEISKEYAPVSIHFGTVAKPKVVPSTLQLTDGGDITYTIRVKSFGPPNFVNSSFDGPKGNIYGGGVGTTFTPVGNGTYETTVTNHISKYAPSGKYVLSGVTVENRSGSVSPASDQIVVDVRNPSQDLQKPQIVSVTPKVETLPSGEIQVTRKLVVNSKSPVDFLNSSLEGPKGSVYGGGSGVTFTEVQPGVYEYTVTDTLSKHAPKGTYTYSNLSVKNEGQNQSEEFTPLSVEVK